MNKILLISGLGLVVLIITIVLVVVLTNSSNETHTPPATNEISSGFQNINVMVGSTEKNIKLLNNKVWSVSSDNTSSSFFIEKFEDDPHHITISTSQGEGLCYTSVVPDKIDLRHVVCNKDAGVNNTFYINKVGDNKFNLARPFNGKLNYLFINNSQITHYTIGDDVPVKDRAVFSFSV